jgi:hypothetical protein
VLGFAAALFGLGFTFGEDVAKRAFTRLALWPPLKVAIGGLGVGLVALVVPEVIGTGDNLPPIARFRGPIQAMLDGRIDAGTRPSGSSYDEFKRAGEHLAATDIAVSAIARRARGLTLKGVPRVLCRAPATWMSRSGDGCCGRRGSEMDGVGTHVESCRGQRRHRRSGGT